MLPGGQNCRGGGGAVHHRRRIGLGPSTAAGDEEAAERQGGESADEGHLGRLQSGERERGNVSKIKSHNGF
jgi:hypothetical protein